jgi:hypothetical protein
MKKFYESKTLWFNVITVLLAVLALPELVSLIPEDSMPYIALANGIGNMILRFLTTQPIE